MQQQSNSRSNRNGYYGSQGEENPKDYFTLIQEMIAILKQERLSPMLMPFQHNIFKLLKERLQEQEGKLKEFKYDSDPSITNFAKNYHTVIYSMEIQKVSYILKHYLKIRLDKIQKYCFYYYKNKTQSESLMSKSEAEFLKKYVTLRYNFYEEIAQKNVNKNFRGIGGIELFLGKRQNPRLLQSNQSKSEIIEPDMKSYVFARIKNNPKEFMYKNDMQIQDVAPHETIASQNDIIFVPYETLKTLMDRSKEEYFQLI